MKQLINTKTLFSVICNGNKRDTYVFHNCVKITHMRAKAYIYAEYSVNCPDVSSKYA